MTPYLRQKCVDLARDLVREINDGDPSRFIDGERGEYDARLTQAAEDLIAKRISDLLAREIER